MVDLWDKNVYAYTSLGQAIRLQTSIWIPTTVVQMVSRMRTTDSMWLMGERFMHTRVRVSVIRLQTSICIATTVVQMVSRMRTTDSMWVDFSDKKVYVYMIPEYSSGGGGRPEAIRRLTNYRDDDSSPSWSPDGRHIAFHSIDLLFGGDIYVMGSDGSNPRRLTSWIGDDVIPSWSPDGRHIAFTSYRRDGHYEIYVMGSNGSNPRRLTLPQCWRRVSLVVA